MTAMRLSFPLLMATAVVACVAHPAAAAGPATLEATVAGLVLEGSLRIEGALGALSSTGHFDPGSDTPAELAARLLAPAGDDPRVAPTSLQLKARHLRVDTDLQRHSGSPFAGPSDQTPQSRSFSDAVASGLPARGGFEFYLAPLPGRDPPLVRVDAVQAHLQPVPLAPAEPDRKITSPIRGPIPPAPGPATLASGGLRALHVEGDLVLMLWEWDLDLVSAATVVHSGYTYTATTPSMQGVDTVGNGESRQVFLYAEGATLDLALPLDVSAVLALQPRAANFDGRLVLEGPSGRLATTDGERALRDGDWLDGTFTADLSQPDAFSLHTAFQGTGRQAHLAGLTVAIANPAPSSAGVLTALLAASGLALMGSWRLWGRRHPRAASSTQLEADDELRTLHWLDERSEQAAVLWDSDLMRAFEWSAERAQGILRGLQAKGQLRCKDVALAGGRSSLGHIALTAAGANRLRTGAGGSGGVAVVGRRSLRRRAADF
ncbi:MAG: hypothetical protein ABR586_01935 [Thermoplasmatota archaeon]